MMNKAQKKNRLLIVDDEPENIELYRTILGLDYEIAEANTGEQALSLLESFSPDVMLLDIVLPDISGLDVCRQIRENETHKLLKILMVSGRDTLEERLEGYSAGADDYVTKPVELDELLAKVKVYSKLRNIEEVDNYKTTFMRLINHETITPLNAIIGFADLLKGSDIGEEDKHFVDEIFQAGKKLHEKIQRIMLLNKLLNSDDDYDIQHVHIKVAIQDVLHSLEKHFEQKHIELELNLPSDDSLTVLGNEHLIHKAIFEVLDNAIKYSPENAKVLVHGEIVDQGFLLRIEDEGPGLTEEQITYGFDMFNSADIMHHVQGLCMSLVLTNIVMKRYGGKLSVCNAEQKGAQITMQFALVEDAS